MLCLFLCSSHARAESRDDDEITGWCFCVSHPWYLQLNLDRYVDRLLTDGKVALSGEVPQSAKSMSNDKQSTVHTYHKEEAKG